ncbi:MAG TPA: FISUMP domain-containing protein [Rhizomicrobium sp.]|nr:FISUMP domain-containing protein [Rhizomicrobium sp.]
MRLLYVISSLALVSCAASGAKTVERDAAITSAKRMLDGNLWTTKNLALGGDGTYCFGGKQANCARYGRLHTWEAAIKACRSLGAGWRLPTDDDWKRLAVLYGGLYGDPSDPAKTAYASLRLGSGAGFDVQLGGNRTETGDYKRLEAHGFYWSATETGPRSAWFYNFGQASPLPNRHDHGSKEMAISVRCVK